MTLTDHILSAIDELVPDMDPLTRGRLTARMLRLMQHVHNHGIENVLLDVDHRIPTAEALADSIRQVADVWAPRFMEHATSSDVREVERYRAEIERLEGRIQAVNRRVHDRSLRKKPKTAICECGSVISKPRCRPMTCPCGNPRMISLDAA